MKTKLLLTAALAAALAAPAFAAGSFTLEGLALTRSDYESTLLATNFAPTPDALFRADDIDVDWTGGARATYQNDFWGHTWQLSAFFVAPSHTNATFTSSSDSIDTTYDNFLGSDINTTNSDAARAVSAVAEWEMWGAEFNWVKNLSGWGWKNVDFLLGVRYLNLSEDLNTLVDDDSEFFGSSAVFKDVASITARNNLAGLQIGIQGDWNLTNSVSIGGNIKGGVAANFASRSRSFDTVAGLANPLRDSIDDTGFAQFAEFNPRLTIALSDSAALTVGGNVTWINDITTAAAHYQSVADRQDTNIRDNQDVLVYGATVGLKIALN